MSGKFPLMIFGLPGAALAMYTTADSDKKGKVFGLLLSAALTSMLTGITEPLEFTFLFVAPLLYVIHCVFAGAAYMLMHIFHVGVGMTFSGGLIDLFLFGILQGNAKTNWLWVVFVGIGYFIVYYLLFTFLIKKWNLNTPGRGETEDVKLYTRADVNAKKSEGSSEESGNYDVVSINICNGLGGKKNISDVDCCATRLRCTVRDASLVNEPLLKSTGASGVVFKGNGVQIIYGPKVTVVKSNLEDYLETASDTLFVSGESAQAQITVKSPVKGLAAGVDIAPDEAFSQKMMGDGAVIYPAQNYIVAPFDGTVTMLFDTRHAIGLENEEGIEILIHIGIDTVNLNGEGFTAFVAAGDTVKEGQKLIEFDSEFIVKNATSDAIPVVVTNAEDNWQITLLKSGNVEELEDLFQVTM